MAFPFHIQEHTLDAAHMREFPCATANSQEDILSLHVKQYTPIDNPHPQKGDITIIGAHANGFPKVRLLLRSVHLHTPELTLSRKCMSPFGQSFTTNSSRAASASGPSAPSTLPGKAKAGF